MNKIVHLSAADCEELLAMLEGYRDSQGLNGARINTEQGGFKISINHGVWTPPMGEIKSAN